MNGKQFWTLDVNLGWIGLYIMLFSVKDFNATSSIICNKKKSFIVQYRLKNSLSKNVCKV